MSWWADSWQSAIEGDIFDDTSRLRAGQNLARRARVPVEIEPGAATGRFVKGAQLVAATVSFKAIDDEGWRTFCALVAKRPAVAGAVLTGQFPPELEGQADDAKIRLQPYQGAVSSVCSCEEWDEPCQHVWALLLTLIDTIEVDPFTVLVLLGRSRKDLLDGVRSHRSGSGSASAAVAGPRGEDPGMDPALAFSRPVGPMPRPQPLPRMAGQPVELATPPPADSGITDADLVRLVSDAAQRATAHLQGTDIAGLHRSPEADLVRRAASLPRDAVRNDLDELDDLADAALLKPEVLRAKAVAWRLAGEAGLAVHDERWEPAVHEMAAGTAVLGERARSTGNIVSATLTSDRLGSGIGVQLRLSPDRRWWRFEADEQLGWVLASDGFTDPADALPDDARSS